MVICKNIYIQLSKYYRKLLTVSYLVRIVTSLKRNDNGKGYLDSKSDHKCDCLSRKTAGCEKILNFQQNDIMDTRKCKFVRP